MVMKKTASVETHSGGMWESPLVWRRQFSSESTENDLSNTNGGSIWKANFAGKSVVSAKQCEKTKATKKCGAWIK